MLKLSNNLWEQLRQNPEAGKFLKVEIQLDELMTFFTLLEHKYEKALQPASEPKEELMTSKEVAEEFKISLVTLWNYDKKGITKPVRIGSQKRYKRSDIEELFTNKINKDEEN